LAIAVARLPEEGLRTHAAAGEVVVSRLFDDRLTSPNPVL
jgi:hypothetical protein